MNYQFNFRHYQRKFKTPLQTHHGTWLVREGIILQLMDCDRRIGLGEIAPLPWFGSETLAEALNFCWSIGSTLSKELIDEIPDSLPACQFGFESAFNNLYSEQLLSVLPNNKYSYLLPTGEKALEIINNCNHEFTTYKWKIGVASFEVESQIFQKLIKKLPELAKIRLDANGGMTLEEAKKWLSLADAVGKVEFIEQPLPSNQFSDLLKLTENFKTAIALDESIANLGQLKSCYQEGWRGIYIIKAAIIGSPKQLQTWCQNHAIDVVFSSVFETKIGQEAVLQLAEKLNQTHRALGFGVNHWFEDSDELFLEKF